MDPMWDSNPHFIFCFQSMPVLLYYNILYFISEFVAQSMVEMGESMKQMADAKYSLDDNIKQNFLEPLHHLQTKDLKEVMVCCVMLCWSLKIF